MTKFLLISSLLFLSLSKNLDPPIIQRCSSLDETHALGEPGASCHPSCTHGSGAMLCRRGQPPRQVGPVTGPSQSHSSPGTSLCSQEPKDAVEIRSPEPGACSRSPVWVQGPKDLNLSWILSRELDGERNSQDTNRRPCGDPGTCKGRIGLAGQRASPNSVLFQYTGVP